MKKVILGNGLLGEELKKQTGWDQISRSEDGFDITLPQNFKKLLGYDVVVNCIASTSTYSTERNLHWKTNFRAVADLTDFCNKHNIKLVHISTDYVYANSKIMASEEDVPVSQETWYAHTKLLGDSYIQLRGMDYLIIRCQHKPRPFPYEEAYLNSVGNFDYVDVISDHIRNLINKGATGVYNVGTDIKTMYSLAKQTKPDVTGSYHSYPLMPTNTTMDLTKATQLCREL